MAKVIFGNHSSVLVPRQDRESIREFYCDVLGGKVTKADPERDFIRLGEDFYIGFLYGDVPDESEFLRTGRSVWLEIKSYNLEEMARKILDCPRCFQRVRTDARVSFHISEISQLTSV